MVGNIKSVIVRINFIHDKHRWRGVTRDRDNKAHRDLNYVGHETIHINLPFTRSRKSEDVEIVKAET